MGKVTFRSITEMFLQMEDDLDLFDQQIGGVYFWERIRFSLHREILQSADVIGQAHTGLERTITNRARGALCALKNAFIKNPYFAPKSELLFFGSPQRRLRYDGKWWDIYCDLIIDYLDRKCIYFEPAYLNSHLAPAKTSNIRYLDFPSYLAAAKRKLKLVRFSLTAPDRRTLRNIQEQIISRFKVSINLEEKVKKDLLFRRSVLPVYRALLKKVSPKLVFVVCSYGKETFIEACKSMGIPVVELQHGVISPYHLGYAFPGPKRTKRTFPDYFFAFGDFWKNGIEYPIGKDRVFSVGYPYLENEAKRYRGIKKKNQMVFISQGTVGRKMSRFAVELSKQDDFPLEIIYKLHPGEYARWRKEYPWLIQAGVRVVDDDSIPLYQLFAESKIQVGVNSTAIFEGLNFGLKTILLDLPGIEYMQYLIKERVAQVVSSPGDLAEEICNGTIPKIQTERFFKLDSLNNIKQAIDELLNTETDMR